MRAYHFWVKGFHGRENPRRLPGQICFLCSSCRQSRRTPDSSDIIRGNDPADSDHHRFAAFGTDKTRAFRFFKTGHLRVEDTLNASQCFLRISVEETIVAHPAKPFGQNVAEQEEQELCPGRVRVFLFPVLYSL